MVFFLIGGAPRCGKSTLARQISKQLSIPWISTDTLESVIESYFSEDAFADYFPKHQMRRETLHSNDVMYSQYGTDQIIDAYKRQAETAWPGITAFIKAEMKYGHSYVLEGHHLRPSFVSELQKTFDVPIKSVFLGRSDIDTIVRSATEYPSKGDWFVGKTEDSSIYPTIAKMIKNYSAFFQREAKDESMPYIDVDEDFNAALQKAVSILV